MRACRGFIYGRTELRRDVLGEVLVLAVAGERDRGSIADEHGAVDSIEGQRVGVIGEDRAIRQFSGGDLFASLELGRDVLHQRNDQVGGTGVEPEADPLARSLPALRIKRRSDTHAELGTALAQRFLNAAERLSVRCSSGAPPRRQSALCSPAESA